jgi:SSS family solute:Na+ symporter
VIRGGKELYDYLQTVQGYLAPPIFVVFFNRLNSKGCLWALITGSILGLFRLAVDTPVKLSASFGSGEPFNYATGSFLWIVNKIYFQYYSVLITLVSAAVMIGVSYLTKAPAYEKISGLTFGTLTDEHRRSSRANWSATEVIASAIVLLLILGAYLCFRG